MRNPAVAVILLVAGLCCFSTARADETQDLAICLNITVITGRDAPPGERLVACNRMIERHRTQPEAEDFYHRAGVYGALERQKDALADLDKALEISAPGDNLRAEYHLSRARTILMAGLRAPQEAVADATAAIEIISAIGPNYSTHGDAEDLSTAYFWRGGAYAEMNDRLRASADFKKALGYDVAPEWRAFMVKLMTGLGYPPD